jgi:lipoate-protein ligase B
MPVVAYGRIWELQKKLVRARKNGFLKYDVALLLEHTPVFTLGRRGGKEFLTVSEAFLERKGIPIYHIERGGYITYHGPGQLIVYFIFDLARSAFGVADFVSRLEEVMIRLSADWGIKAQRNSKNPGVWVGGKKLGSLGIAVRRGIAFHGFAFNVNVSLEPFSWVHPCGLLNTQVTSLAKERNAAVPMTQVRRAVRLHLQRVFDVDLWEWDISQMMPFLRGVEGEIKKKAG